MEIEGRIRSTWGGEDASCDRLLIFRRAAAVEDARNNLLIEEYKSCRDLIKTNIDIMEKLEVYSIGAIAAVTTFALSKDNSTVEGVAIWLPLVITVAGFIRFLGVDSTIGKINDYLKGIEGSYGSLGWTSFYRRSARVKMLKFSRYLVWAILFAFSLSLPAYRYLPALIKVFC